MSFIDLHTCLQIFPKKNDEQLIIFLPTYFSLAIGHGHFFFPQSHLSFVVVVDNYLFSSSSFYFGFYYFYRPKHSW
jgi:hypothetical protein